jgi:excisionase family DNA binding protein
MDALKDWYRYVDQVSRPARRTGEDAEPEAAWRPWRDAAPAAEPVEAVRAAAVPDLGLGLGDGVRYEARHSATPEFHDPTIYDELQPMAEFPVPELSAPAFEVSIPGFLARSTPGPDVREAAQESGAKGGAALAERPRAPAPSPSPDPLDGSAASANAPPELSRASHYWELLAQIRGQESAVPGMKPRVRESREELLQRLLDPVLSLEETALLLGVCSATVRRYTNKGHLNHFRTEGNQRRFRFSDVVEFLESRAPEIEADARADREAGLE